MKFLYVVNARIPSERAHALQIMKTCEALAHQGVDVTLAVPWRFGVKGDDPFVFYGIRTPFSFVRLPSLDLTLFGKYGFRISSILFALLVFWYALLKNINVVYSRDESPLLAVSLLRKKIFWESHDGRYNILTKMLFRRLTGLIVITKGLCDHYRHIGYEGPIHISPDAIDLDDFSISVSKSEAREKLGLSQQRKYVFYIGSLQEWKGVDTFLDASTKSQEVTFVVVGGYQHEIEKLKERYPHVTFLGERPYRDLPWVQRAADILVIPNTARFELSSRFTSPLKLFTYMASGVPIVASDVPAIREIVSEKEVFFFTPDDPQNLSGVITYVENHLDDARQRAQKAVEKVQAYSWDARAERIYKFT